MNSSSPKMVRVAVTQAEPCWFDLNAAVAKTCQLIVTAAENGAKLVVFPECWIPGYPCWIWTRLVDFDLGVKYIKNSLSVSSPQMRAIQACAKDNDIAVCLGFSENENNSLYIAQIMVGPDGTLSGHRRKMKPTHMERTVFGDASGHCLTAVSPLPLLRPASEDLVRVGALSCWEHIQPLLKFATLAQGEDIHVAAWPSLEVHKDDGPGLWSMSREGCHTQSRMYAIEAGCFVLHCTALTSDKSIAAHNNAGGAIMAQPGGGSSAVFGPDGRRLSEPLDEHTEGIVYADLDMDAILRVKMFADCTGHYSRPDLLRLMADKEVKNVLSNTS
ncbi:unnamed protein product [Mycena citricolor]|uniref:CN hydrolase domain-containing protein n=1 Tax=Mycena citricolor TaxID=2018698 RepID=A0AAD2H019_9AGAR|nr:unnamed protein product [Mycena citricolor]